MLFSQFCHVDLRFIASWVSFSIKSRFSRHYTPVYTFCESDLVKLAVKGLSVI